MHLVFGRSATATLEISGTTRYALATNARPTKQFAFLIRVYTERLRFLMLYVVQPQLQTRSGVRVLAMVLFIALTAVAAQVKIPLQPVPVTLQVFAVLLAGLVLGPRDAALSIVGYLTLIASGLPLDANHLGAAALAGPTAGYLWSFPAAAWLAGMLAIRQQVVVRWLAGLAGVVVIYAVGATWLQLSTGATWDDVWSVGVQPFILADIAKAGAAAVLARGGAAALEHWSLTRGHSA